MDKKRKRFYRPPVKTPPKSQMTSAKYEPTQTVQDVAKLQQGVPQTLAPNPNPTLETVRTDEPWNPPPAFPRPGTRPRISAPQGATAQAPTNTAPPEGTSPPPLGRSNFDPAALSAVLQNSPILLKIRENEDKIRKLREMPVQDENGRMMSFANAGLQGLAEAFNPATMGRGGNPMAGFAYAAGKAVGGLINKKWDEKQAIGRRMKDLYEENDYLTEQAKVEFDMQKQAAQFGLQTEKAASQAELGKGRLDIQRGQLEERKAQNQFGRLNADKQLELNKIFKRGFYYEGDDEDQDIKLKEMGIILPDFDTRLKPITDNGQRKAWNPVKREYEPIQGSDVDPDEEPVTFIVDGEEITASRKHFLNYKAQKERTATSQSWDATKMGYEAGQDQAKLRGDLAAANARSADISRQIADLDSQIATGNLDPTTAETRRNQLLSERIKADSEAAGIQTRISSTPKPPPAPTVTVGTPNRVVGTAEDFRKSLQRIKR